MTAIAAVDPAVLRRAMIQLACPPQAQRRYVQLRTFQPACELARSYRPEQADGALTERQAAMLRLVAERLDAVHAAGDDVLRESEAQRREYLWSDALESPPWQELRRAARACLAALEAGGE